MTPIYPPNDSPPELGSLDGYGAADCDLPYRFGRRPTSAAPFPFSTRQFARLLVLRSRVERRPFAVLELRDAA